MSLNYYRRSWPLDEAHCPCDVHFVSYLREFGIGGKTIFHFGTGQHHLVGVKNHELDHPNHILGITASPFEHETYVRLIIDDPTLARTYKVLFCDIYTLTTPLLPRFDVVTLFHLCEYYSTQNRSYTDATDASVLQMFVDLLSPGGEVLVYRRSAAFDETRKLIDALIDAGEIVKRADFESLSSYGRVETR
jgi:hypothetical protein